MTFKFGPWNNPKRTDNGCCLCEQSAKYEFAIATSNASSIASIVAFDILWKKPLRSSARGARVPIQNGNVARRSSSVTRTWHSGSRCFSFHSIGKFLEAIVHLKWGSMSVRGKCDYYRQSCDDLAARCRWSWGGADCHPPFRHPPFALHYITRHLSFHSDIIPRSGYYYEGQERAINFYEKWIWRFYINL
jgi:hypothetical protein